MDKNRSMVDVAYELMSKKKKAVNFYKLWQEVSEVKGFDEEEKSLFSPTTAEANFHQKTASNVIVEGSSLFLVAIILLTLMTWEKL